MINFKIIAVFNVNCIFHKLISPINQKTNLQVKFQGNIRKMRVANGEEVSYKLPFYNILEKGEELDMNALVGKEIQISFEGDIHCVVSGKKIRKAYGEGMSYDAFRESPLAVESIIRPELSQIHLGIALRDEAWEREHHLQPHLVYLSYTGDVKVGVTRDTQIPTRWIDQGAVAAIPIALTPYRQAAGLIEVALKNQFSDKTNWRKMLQHVEVESDLSLEKLKAQSFFPEEFIEFALENSEVSFFKYPVLKYPEKIKSIKLDSKPVITQKLMGIKGQYLIFDNGEVLNIRSHTAYRISFEF